jgi:hypothetical protein
MKQDVLSGQVGVLNAYMAYCWGMCLISNTFIDLTSIADISRREGAGTHLKSRDGDGWKRCRPEGF